jgi:hypothetical protein
MSFAYVVYASALRLMVQESINKAAARSFQSADPCVVERFSRIYFHQNCTKNHALNMQSNDEGAPDMLTFALKSGMPSAIDDETASKYSNASESQMAGKLMALHTCIRV